MNSKILSQNEVDFLIKAINKKESLLFSQVEYIENNLIFQKKLDLNNKKISENKEIKVEGLLCNMFEAPEGFYNQFKKN